MDVLDSLFSILPIAFAVIWVLSRVGRTRKKRQTPAAKDRKGSAERKTAATPPWRTPPGKAGTVPAPENLARWIAEKAREVREAQETTEREGVSPGEEELYARLENRRIEPSEHRRAVPAAAESEETHRVVDDAEPIHKTDERIPTPAVLDRIADLPPLAQGFLWSVILDEPQALKGPPGN